MIRKIYMIEVISTEGELIARRFAANKKTAEHIAKHYGNDAEIRPLFKDEYDNVNIKTLKDCKAEPGGKSRQKGFTNEVQLMEIRVVTRCSDIVICEGVNQSITTIYSTDLKELDEIGKSIHRKFYALHNPLSGLYMDRAKRTCNTDDGFLEVTQNRIDDKCFFITIKLTKN